MKKAQSLVEYVLIMLLLITLTIVFVLKFNFNAMKQGATFGVQEEGRVKIPPMTL